jgi:hypothetical protein
MMRISRSGISGAAAVLLLLCCGATVVAAKPHDPTRDWCGTGAPIRDLASGKVVAAGVNESLLLQRHARAARDREQSGFVPLGASNGDLDNIAVLEDDGTLTIAGSQTIDLANFEFRMTPNGTTGYDLVTAGVPGIQSPQGSDLGLGDDDTMEVAFTSGFTFTYFGQAYSSVWVNSDGNVSFGQGDSASTARTPGRLLYGPPRIAPMLTDLDPTSGAGSEVRYIQNGTTSVFITWNAVPKFGGSGTSTFQIRLFATGVVEISYTTISWTGSSDLTGVTGYAPGFGQGPVTALDWTTDLPQTNLTAALEGWNGSSQRIMDDIAVANRFYQLHGDDYDFLVVFGNFTYSLGGAFAYHAGVFNDIQGINRGDYDNRADYGSAWNLESFLQMGPLSQWPADPNLIFLGQNDTFAIFGQEAGHRWLAFILLDSPPFPDDIFLLGRQNAHWSYFHNTETITSSGAEHRSSCAEGNDLIEIDPDSFDVESCVIKHFSDLDRYLIGLIDDSAVATSGLWVTTDTSSTKTPSSAPSCIVPQWNGASRFNFTMADVISANGPRVPDVTSAQKKWTQAVVMVVLNGTFPPPQADLDKLNLFRAGWGPYFAEGTGFLGEVETRLIQGVVATGTGTGGGSRTRKHLRIPVP